MRNYNQKIKKNQKRILAVFLSILLTVQVLAGVLFYPTPEKAKAVSGSWTQTSWVGGSGQADWSDATKYSAETEEGVYASTDLRMKMNADVVVGQQGFDNEFANGGTLGGEHLDNPYSTFSDGTRLFVADSDNNRVLIYNSIPTTNNATADVVIGQADFTTYTSGTSATEMDGPYGLYSDGTRLFVADFTNNRVLIYNSIPTENGVAADIVVGQTDFITNTSGTSATEMDRPSIVYSDGTKLFVADSYNSRVLIYNSIPTENGASADVVIGQTDFTTNTSGTSATEIDHPFGLYSDGTRLFVADSWNHRVLIYNSIPTENGASADVVVGQPDFTTNSSGTSATEIYNPESIFSDGTKLFVVDSMNFRVLIYNSIPTTNGASADVVVGQTDFTTGFSFDDPSATNMMLPYGAHSDGTKLFVADNWNNRVLIYNSIPTENGASADVVVGQSDFNSGDVNHGIGDNPENGLYDPFGVYSDGTKLFVADTTNNRVLIYNSIPTTNNATADVVIGQSDFTTNTSGVSATEMYAPTGLYSDGVHLFVTDYYNRRVLIYNSIPTENGASADVVVGQPDFTTNSSGSTATKTSKPMSVYSDGTKLFVADKTNNRILIYNSIPTENGVAADVVVGQPDFTTSSSGVSSTKMYYPSGVYSDGTRLFVADSWNHRILIYNTVPTTNNATADVVIGQTDFIAKTFGISATKIYVPSGVYSDGTKLFITETYNNRVLIYNSISTTNGTAADMVIGQPDFETRPSGISATKMYYPTEVYFDGTKLFVADQGNHRVLLYDLTPVSTTLTSSIYDAGAMQEWGPITWTEDAPDNTAIAVEVSTDSGTTWTAVTNGQSYVGKSQTMQYRITLSNTDGLSTPTLSDITLNYKTNANPAAFTLSSPANNGSASNNQPTLSWSASSDSESGLSHYQLYIDGSLDTNNISGASTVPTNTLSCGAHSWYVRAVDNAGNTTDSGTFNLTLSCGGAIPSAWSKPPAQPSSSMENPQGGFSVLINNGAKITDSRTVSLKFFAGDDTKRMAISEDADSKRVGQEPYAATKEWTLHEGDGTKTVYAKFYTQYGAVSEVVSDSIILKSSVDKAETNKQEAQEKQTAKNTTIAEEKDLITKIDKKLSKRVSGNILLQVEKNGEGWYVYPDNQKKYYLGRPADAFSIMRNLGLGIAHSELNNYFNAKFPSRLSGKILLDVEQNGEAYYINPNDLKGHYLSRPSDAFRIMRELGLGITNDDVRKIDVGEIE